jgi:hypothetical protein
MKRFRLSTLMLLVVIAALSIALVVQQRRATRREAKLHAELQLRQGQLQLTNENLQNRESLLKHDRMIARMELTERTKLNMELEQMRLRGQAAGAKEGTKK